MATKDWKKTYQSSIGIKWEKNGNVLDVFKIHSSEKRLIGWGVTEPWDWKVKSFKTKAAALKYAKSYMRSH